VLPDDVTQPPAHELLLTVLGDYLLHDDDGIWSSRLVALLGDLGVRTPAARMALSRLHGNRLVVRHQDGRRTMYQLAPRGRSLIAEGRDEIFGFGRQPTWDGHWTLLTYSLTEDQRSLRHELRRRLRFLGFTGAFTSTWIAVRDRRRQLERLVRELGVEEDSEIFVGVPSNVERLGRMIRDRWNVADLEPVYHRFLDEYNSLGSADLPSDRKRFVVRTSMMQSFRQFPVMDPDLPAELGGKSVLRDQVVNLFHDRWHELEKGATRHVHASTPAEPSFELRQ
jgi:phenylacetic acid degradation operon negative regulatory protein